MKIKDIFYKTLKTALLICNYNKIDLTSFKRYCLALTTYNKQTKKSGFQKIKIRIKF